MLSPDELLELASEDELSGVVVDVSPEVFVEDDSDPDDDEASDDESEEEAVSSVELDREEDDAFDSFDDDPFLPNSPSGSFVVSSDDSGADIGTKIDCGFAPMPCPWLET